MPALFALLSAACAILVPNYQHVQRPAKQSQAAVMHAGCGKRIPELSEIYELAPLITYDGWERDVRSLERKWLRGSEVDIQREVAKMRRWQCLHDGDRTDAALQMLDAVKQGLTYKGWEKDVRAVEWTWARTGGVSSEYIHRVVAKMRRCQCLHDGDRTDAALQVLDAVKQGLTYPGWEKDVRDVERFRARWGKVSHIQEVVAKMRRQQQRHTIESSVVD